MVSDAWIPRTINFKPNELTMMPPHITKVHDLISPSGGWNNALISTLFSAEDATAIAAIPLPSHEATDRIVWHLEKSGIFSVKTAYRYSFHHSQVHQPFDLTVGVAFWKKIWKVNIPNGAKVNIWRVCHNILPTLEKLQSKHVPLESVICLLCAHETESPIHLCRDCPFTRQVIQSNNILSQVCLNPASLHLNLWEWLNKYSQNLSSPMFGELISLLWGIWKERNNRVCDGKNGTALDVVFSSMARLNDFRYVII